MRDFVVSRDAWRECRQFFMRLVPIDATSPVTSQLFKATFRKYARLSLDSHATTSGEENAATASGEERSLLAPQESSRPLPRIVLITDFVSLVFVNEFLQPLMANNKTSTTTTTTEATMSSRGAASHAISYAERLAQRFEFRLYAFGAPVYDFYARLHHDAITASSQSPRRFYVTQLHTTSSNGSSDGETVVPDKVVEEIPVVVTAMDEAGGASPPIVEPPRKGPNTAKCTYVHA